ncbi:alpha/beta hydrolase-fold protein [Arenibacter sp. M-2]|uniref:alpha/beta hydrolase n=1 Tax=Arenibacter sp. M-2 TaxID=3053612 RepID=UPI002570E917|nr:alpha/beta hydrolase-fold protein [Arenibacter sp. M-2]MDL5512130.1 alpha/beta hydrolase-fold protein [Arenibacter sp. M-2]
MNFLKSINLSITTFLWLIFCNPLFSQKLEPKEQTGNEPDHIISSKIMEKDYQLHMSFPRNYSTKDTITYPVVYVLDGKSTYKYFNPSNVDFENIEDVIIVGISHKVNGTASRINRFYDYTPSLDTITARKIEESFGVEKGTIKTGGADEFLKCLKKEIIPFIDKHYKTNFDRGISGHSLGGLFTAFCFLNSDGYFTRFGINSPSLQWDEEKLLAQAILKFTKNETLDIKPTKAFFSTGENENPIMVSNMIKFSLYLKKSDYKNIDMNWYIYRNESHKSVIPSSLSGTLTTLYGK